MKIVDLQAFIAAEAELFPQFAISLTEDKFAARTNGRWSVGDTVQHLYLSARPVLRLVGGPREVFAQWGEAAGPTRSYAELADTYKQVLGKGLKAPASFSPRPDDVPADKATVLARLSDTYLGLGSALATWSEEELDRHQMPHPALGLISVREMLHFIGIHTRHHRAVLQAY